MARLVKFLILLVVFVGVSLVSGCTNWQKKYQALNVEHENTVGLLEQCRAEKQRLSSQISQSEQTIEELQRKIEELNQSPAQAAGFGEGYDVSVDAEEGTVTVTLPNAILFKPGRASLKSAKNSELNHIVSVLKDKYPNNLVDVVGHTDSDPIEKSDWEDNWELSAERALSVTRYLIENGINENRLRAVGRGPSQPVASNDTASGKAKNRRVEIVVELKRAGAE